MAKPSPDIAIGSRFGLWTVLSKAGTSFKGGGLRWNCRCRCGVEKPIRLYELRRQTTSGCSTCRSWLLKPDAGFNEVIRKLKSQAKLRNLQWNLTDDECMQLFRQNCIYCNNTPCNRQMHGLKDTEVFVWSGLDRIDSSVGYVSHNVVPCCFRCNSAKNDMSIQEFKVWLTRTYKFFVKGKNNNG